MLETSLKQELDAILDNHRTRKRRQKLAPATRELYVLALELLCRHLGDITPGRVLTSLGQFTVADVEAYYKYLEAPHDGRKYKPASIKTLLMPFKTIFAAAFKKGLAQEDVSAPLDLDWVAESEAGKRLLPEEVERLCRIKPVDGMSLRDRFLHLRNVAMLRVQKDAALRPGEVMRLCVEDIYWTKRHPNGIVPIVIQEGKRREVGSKDSAYLTPWSTDFLKRYLTVRAEFCKATGIAPTPILSQWDKRAMGEALFFTVRGTHMTVGNYELVFREALAFAKVDRGYTPHDLRHTQISEWADAGLNPVWTQKLARHLDVSTTLRKYYHIIENDLVKGLGKINAPAEAIDLQKAPVDLLPKREVRRALFRVALEQMGQVADEVALDRLDHAATGGKDKMADLYYTVQETCARLGIQRTQLYMGWMKAGHLTAHKVGERTVFLRAEVEAIAGLRTTEEAAKALGYNEKRPTTILRYVDQGQLKAIKIGNTFRFRDTDLVDFLRDKNSGRLRLEVKCRESRADQARGVITGENLFGSASF